MADSKVAEQRYFPRYHVVKTGFSGKLYHEENQAEIFGQVIDVSREGIGALVTTPLQCGNQVILKFNEKSVTFTVRHCQEDLIFKDKYRVGLMRASGATENVLQLFAMHGFLA